MSTDTALITDTAERLFADLATPETVNAAEAGTWPAALWQALEETGLTLVLVPEEAGGAGGDLSDAAAILRAAASHAAPVPLAETLLAAWALSAAGIAVPEGPLSIAPVVPGDRLRIESERVSGVARRVPWGRDAGHVVVFGEAGTVALVRTGDADIDRGANVAGEPRDDISFDGIPAVAAGTVPGLDRGRLHERGALVRSVQMAGAMDRILVMSVQYGGERKQFGRPLAKFQAIQQQLAVLAGHAAAAGTAADAAVSAAEGDADASLAIAAAKARTSEAAGIVAGIAHQVHGAMGFTYEHALHHFTRRLWSWREEFGNEALWNRTLGMRVAAAGGETLWPLITAT